MAAPAMVSSLKETDSRDLNKQGEPGWWHTALIPALRRSSWSTE